MLKTNFKPFRISESHAMIYPPILVDTHSLDKELRIVRREMEDATPSQKQFDRKADTAEGFDSIYREWALDALTPEEFKVLYPNGVELREDIQELERRLNRVILREKRRYAFPRPNKYLPEKLYDYKATSAVGGSYPSGHSAIARFRSKLIGYIFPIHRMELEKIAHEIGWGRIRLGVHYPQDYLAGKHLADMLYRETIGV